MLPAMDEETERAIERIRAQANEARLDLISNPTVVVSADDLDLLLAELERLQDALDDVSGRGLDE